LIPSYRCSLLSQKENIPQIQTFKNIYIYFQKRQERTRKSKKKAPKQGREKETRDKNKSIWQAYSRKEAGHKEVREQLSTETSTSRLKHIR